MRIIRAGAGRTALWKNGGGSTTEIVAEPADASLDTFDWRISMARVASDGPFSEFAGIDRTLAVIEGTGLVLTIDNSDPVTLGMASDPVSFAGSAKTSARLLAGEITDLNVMTRRARFSHRLIRVREPVMRGFNGDDVAVILSLNGCVTVTSEHEAATLDHGDAAVLLRSHHVAFRILPAADGDCYLALLRAHRAQPG